MADVSPISCYELGEHALEVERPHLKTVGLTRTEGLASQRAASYLNTRSTVAAVVPHYRCERWLGDCLESLIAQTRTPDAIIVLDDHSRPPPVKEVEPFPQVTLLHADRSVGPYCLLQSVIERTAYDAYLHQDADDWSSPDRLEELLREAEQSGAELVGSFAVHLLDGAAEVWPMRYPQDVNAALIRKPEVYPPPHLHPASVVSRDLVVRLGGYSSGLRFNGDREFVNRAVHVARVVNVPKFLYFKRRRFDSLTTHPDTGIDSAARLRIDEALHARVYKNAEARARNEPLLLDPYITTGTVSFGHLLGPQLKWVERSTDPSSRAHVQP
jgi:glycosyltransferase involved in cell wall biosynthesis